MSTFLFGIFVLSLVADVLFGVGAFTDMAANKGLAFQSDLVMLGMSLIATTLAGFGGAMLGIAERQLVAANQIAKLLDAVGVQERGALLEKQQGVFAEKKCPRCGHMSNGVICANCGFEFDWRPKEAAG